MTEAIEGLRSRDGARGAQDSGDVGANAEGFGVSEPKKWTSQVGRVVFKKFVKISSVGSGNGNGRGGRIKGEEERIVGEEEEEQHNSNISTFPGSAQKENAKRRCR